MPFTYTLTMPVLFAPATNVVIDWAGSPNDLHSVVLTDDLNATGVDLTYLGHVAYIQGTNTPVPHTFSNVGGVLTFSDFGIIPAGQQIIIEITVVLDDSPTNVARHAVRQHGEVVLRAADRRRRSTSRCPANGASRRR